MTWNKNKLKPLWAFLKYFGIFVAPVALIPLSQFLYPIKPIRVDYTQEQQGEVSSSQNEKRAMEGARLLKRSMRNPDSLEIKAALIVKDTWTVCYEYHAENGFGGMNVGRAILLKIETYPRTDDTNGFLGLWVDECMGKDGEDVTWLTQRASRR